MQHEKTLFLPTIKTFWNHRCAFPSSSLSLTHQVPKITHMHRHTHKLNHRQMRHQLHRIIMYTLLPTRPPASSILCGNLTYLTLISLSPSPSCCLQMFLTVYLSNNDQHFTEVPVTPETLCRDVVELCKEPGETDCHLSEMWRGSGEWRCQSIQCHPYPSTHNEERESFSHMLFCLWNMAISQQGLESLCRHLFVFFL